MEWHRRMLGILLGCLILICINIVATINGLYTHLKVDNPDQAEYTASLSPADITD